MIVINGLDDNLFVNVYGDIQEGEEKINPFTKTPQTIEVKPGQSENVYMGDESTMYFYSRNKRYERCDSISSEHIQRYTLLDHGSIIVFDKYPTNNYVKEMIEKFNPDIIFYSTYIIPESMIYLYNIVSFLFVYIVVIIIGFTVGLYIYLLWNP